MYYKNIDIVYHIICSYIGHQGYNISIINLNQQYQTLMNNDQIMTEVKGIPVIGHKQHLGGESGAPGLQKLHSQSTPSKGSSSP